ncbi:MAG TPA: hypothetical protein VM618_13695, partial [Acidimicrobiia bacterium]|nr:hypothetical protein [Acidimicrobiia bacterium]
LATGELDWTSEEVTAALSALSDIWTEEFLVGGLTGAASTSFDESVTQTWTEPAGFVYEGDFVAGVISGEEVATVGEDADFVAFPSVTAGGGTEGGTDGGGTEEGALGQAAQDAGSMVVLGGDFPVLLNDTEAGQALMQYLASADAQLIWSEQGGFLSSNRNVDASVYPDDVTRRAAEMIQQAETTRFDLSDQVPPEFGATVGQGMWSIFIDFLRNPDDVEGAAQALQQAAERAQG